MNLKFYKYQGTGNDFVIIDNREKKIVELKTSTIKIICDRKFGIGADGLILLQNTYGVDFEMVYYNSDGTQSFCGNGSRCAVSFAKELQIISNQTIFKAIDGTHNAIIENGIIRLKMSDQEAIENNSDHFFMNNGSPHYIKFVKDVENVDVLNEGKKVRYNERFKKEGTNVNFVEWKDDHLFVRTYERGVENETLSCGTGVTASALVASLKGLSPVDHCKVKTLGGDLKVLFEKKENGIFSDIWLEGPAMFVFSGEITLSYDA